MQRRQTGRLGEDLAVAFLQQRGWQILQRNVRTARGEIDVLARDGDELVFVEVRTRRSATFGTPEESITPRKRQKLIDLAAAYLQTLPSAEIPCRVDVVVVVLGPHDEVRRIDLIPGAIE